MTPAPHPLRCETCNNEWCTLHQKHWERRKVSELPTVEHRFVYEYGCASHSASSDVLEEFWQRLYDGGAFSVNTICDAKRIYDEFRQQTKEQMMRTKEREQG